MFDVGGQRNVQGGINKHPDQLFPCFHKETIVSVAHLLFHQGDFLFIYSATKQKWTEKKEFS